MDPDAARRLLEEERERLLDVRGSVEKEGIAVETEQESTGELSAYDQHPADRGTETFERERAVSVRERVDAQLGEVARALERLEGGNYGVCEQCGRPIGEERLRAQPAARFCIEHQEDAERVTRGR